jgi:hypothetical protein
MFFRMSIMPNSAFKILETAQGFFTNVETMRVLRSLTDLKTSQADRCQSAPRMMMDGLPAAISSLNVKYPANNHRASADECKSNASAYAKAVAAGATAAIRMPPAEE